MPTSPDSAQTHRRAMRDLVALTALPAMWIGYDPRQIAETLADALLNTLSVDFIYLRLCGQDAERLEVLRVLDGRATEAEREDLRTALGPQLRTVNGNGLRRIVNPRNGETINVAAVSVSCGAESGVLAAGARRGDFPCEEDHLLLSVAANQVAIVLQRQRSEEALHRANSRLRLALSGSNIGIWEIDMPDGVLRNGRLQFTNIWEQLGYDRPESPTDFAMPMALVHPDDAAAWEQAIEAYLSASAGELQFEHRVRRKEGTFRWMLTRGMVVRDSAGRPVRLVGSSIDITDRKDAEDAFRKSEVRFRRYFDLGLIGMAITSPSKGCTEVNDEVCRILGYEREELLKKNWTELTHPDDLAADLANFNRVVDGLADGYSMEKRWVRKDGRIVDSIISVKAVRAADGSIDYFVSLLEDISERKRAAKALGESEARFRGTFENAAVGIAHVTADCRYAWVNERMCEILGYGREELLLKTCRQITHPADLAIGVDSFAAMMRGERSSFSIEKRYLRRDGSTVWVNMSVSLQRDAAGNPAYGIEVIQDISELKQAEAELRVANARLDLAMRGSDIGIWEMDTRAGFPGQVHFTNVWESLGYVGAEIPTGHAEALTLLHPDDRGPFERAMRAHLERETSDFEVEVRVRHKDGSYRWILKRGLAVYDGHGKPVRFAGTDLDITEQKRRALRQQVFAEGALKIIASLSVAQPLSATLQVVTDLARQIIGAHQAVTGMIHAGDWSQAVVSASLSDKYAAFRDYEEKPDGSGIYSLVSELNEPLRLTHDQLVQHPRFRWLGKSADRHPPLRGLLAVPLVGRDGQNLGLLMLTDKLEGDFSAEDEAVAVQLGAMASVAIDNVDLYERVQEADRRKDQFLANVSHEIRTPMNAILGMSELVLETALTDEQRKYVATVKSAADALLGIINDLLDFSKIAAGKLDLVVAEFSLRTLLDDTLRTLGVRAHTKGLELACHVLDHVPDALVGDVGRLRQVLLNLLGNAIKFTEHGEVVVRVDMAPPPMGDPGAAPDAIALLFEVVDNGIGIPADQVQRIFQAFEQGDTSTTRRYGGTGLGLSIASRLVEMMGGRITVDSEPGLGSTFRFIAQLQRKAHADAAPPAPRLDLAGAKVLVVDDNRSSRLLLEEWLRGWRADPTSVGSAAAGFQTLLRGKLDGRPYALVLLDETLPDTRGEFLAARISSMRAVAGSKVVLMTSETRLAMRSVEMKPGIDAIATKPLLQEELREILRRLTWMPSTPRPEVGTAVETPRSAEGSSGRAAPPMRSGPRILLAEDNEFNQEMIRHLLERKGYSVTIVGNGREALAVLEDHDFNLLLLDCHMPEVDGFQVVAALRQRERNTSRRLPVIALTALSTKGDRQRCLDAGMDDYLAKPIAAAELYAAINGALVGQRATKTRTETARELIDAPALLAACDGDAGLLSTMVGSFQAVAIPHVLKLRNAIDKQDPAGLRAASHAFRGIVSAFCARAAAVAAELEEMGQGNDMSRAAERHAELEAILRRILEVLPRVTIQDLRDRSARET